MRTAYCFFRPGEFAFTTQPEGGNLPDAEGKWEPYPRVEAVSVSEKGLPVVLAQLEREILIGLATHGYYITSPEAALRRVHFADSGPEAYDAK